MNSSHTVRAAYCSLRGVKNLGVAGAIKFFLASHSSRHQIVHPKIIDQPLMIRGRTSDVETFFSIIIREAYPTANRSVRTIVDAGAHAGYASAYFSSMYPDALILALEPSAENFEMLTKNTRNLPNVVPINRALWSKSEDLYLQNPLDEAWAFQFSRSPTVSDKTRGVSIPELMEEFALEQIDILKIDIEGAEKELFSTDIQWLDKVRSIYIEIHDWLNDDTASTFFDAMSDYSYKFTLRFEYMIFDELSRRTVFRSNS